ncbi:metallophosphoesterase [Aerococcus urinaehominis]|uniref:Metallophosphoesterase n=1 Tax=Aerococcus urinaehominis TaxID=128944 RepID=A0A0X8FLV5_9LACT|nr:TIGR00282 family metallophosphoesterase [Aerococcus urinaehominis]AMB99690.1 metallophosphoesterase [Aerococcus urinaehominis]SDL90657.1 hypothetical protein SAMN04487985_102140 [Aerococcus urinaehominis]
MKILFVGDIVGRLGCDLLAKHLADLKTTYKPQLTIVNGENAARGRGITDQLYREFLQVGADLVTLGNHSFDHPDTLAFIDQADKLIRPANYLPGTPGQGYRVVQVNDEKLAVVNLMGTVFLPDLANPFLCLDQILADLDPDIKSVFVDFHAEATSEKQALAWDFTGRVSAVIGTHTHVQTNDARVLPGGLAYMSDVGMTGSIDSVLGMQKEAVINKFRTQLPTRFNVDDNPASNQVLSACIVDIKADGQARSIKPIYIKETGKQL